MSKSIRDIPTARLKEVRDLCPKKKGRGGMLEGLESVQFSVPGSRMAPVTLTSATRERINAELKRRRNTGSTR